MNEGCSLRSMFEDQDHFRETLTQLANELGRDSEAGVLARLLATHAIRQDFLLTQMFHILDSMGEALDRMANNLG